jgi:hypothetical protein
MPEGIFDTVVATNWVRFFKSLFKLAVPACQHVDDLSGAGAGAASVFTLQPCRALYHIFSDASRQYRSFSGVVRALRFRNLHDLGQL